MNLFKGYQESVTKFVKFIHNMNIFIFNLKPNMMKMAPVEFLAFLDLLSVIKHFYHESELSNMKCIAVFSYLTSHLLTI